MKKSIGKLSLNKLTISNLNQSEMNMLNGGITGLKCTKIKSVDQLTCASSCKVSICDSRNGC